MILNSPTGGRTIFYTPRLATTSVVSPHDPWPSHAVIWQGDLFQQSASGAWYIGSSFTLKDGTQFFYFGGGYATFEEGYAAWKAWQTYKNRDGLVGFYGEWWNEVGRSQSNTKVLTTNFLEWYYSH